MGVRDTTMLRELVRVTGEEHLAANAGGSTILLGFHVGPPGSSFALRLLGYPVESTHDLISRPPMHPGRGRGTARRGAIPTQGPQPTTDAVALHQARRHLVGQGCLYITADGPRGAEASRLPLPGEPVIIREGWLILRRLTGAPTLPILAHREGHRRVITIYPALPPVAPDPRADADACCAVLTDLLGSYLRQFPEQCRATLWRP